MMTCFLLMIGFWLSGSPAAAGDAISAAAAGGAAAAGDEIRAASVEVIHAGADESSMLRPKSPAEMRALALYGRREMYTFTVRSAGAAHARETLAFTPLLHRRAEDSWFGFDKVQHVTFSFLWTLGTQYVAVNKGRLSESQALPLSLTTSAALGLSKEFYDLHVGPTRTFSYRDLIADGLGIVLAAGLILL